MIFRLHHFCHLCSVQVFWPVFRPFYDFKFFKFFFQKIPFLLFRSPILHSSQVRKLKPAKNQFLVLLYSAKSISDQFTISKLFQVFFWKINFFHSFEPYAAKVKNVKSEKKSFLALFYSAKSNTHYFTISSFFRFFFTLSTPILHKWEKWSPQKLTFECYLTVQEQFQTILGIQIFFKTWWKV